MFGGRLFGRFNMAKLKLAIIKPMEFWIKSTRRNHVSALDQQASLEVYVVETELYLLEGMDT